MEFQYKYGAREIRNCGWYLTCKVLRMFWIVPVLAAVIYNFKKIHMLFSQDGQALPAAVQIAGRTLFCFVGFVGIIFLVTVYLSRERFANQDMGMKIEDGLLTVTQGSVSACYSCTGIVRVQEMGGAVWIEWERSKGKKDTLMIPSAVFSSKEERQRFLKFLERQREYARQLDATEWSVDENTRSHMDSEQDGSGEAFCMNVLWTEDMLREARLRSRQIQSMKGFSKRKKLLDLYMFGLVWLVVLLQQMLWRRADMFQMILFGIIMVLLYGINCNDSRKLGKKRKPPIDKSKGMKESLLSKILVGEQGICVWEQGSQLSVDWKAMGYLLELDHWYLIYSTEKRELLHFPADAVGGRKEQADFVEYCRSKGLEYRLLGEEKALGKHKPHTLLKVVVGLFVGLIILFTVLVGPPKRQISNNALSEEVVEETTEYVFNPEDFENYIPLEKQVGVLKSLGIRIPEALVAEERDWMETYPRAHEWLEARPYYMLLSDLGFPDYDEETYEIISYSNQAYSLYWDEAYDVGTSYTELLNGINALSRGEFSLTSPAVLTDGMDAAKQTGTVQIYFLLNGKPYLYDLKVDSDWLDTSILRCLNDALGKEKVSGRIYALDDDGWSCVLFYRDKEWASEFARKTGLHLIMEYVDNGGDMTWNLDIGCQFGTVLGVESAMYFSGCLSNQRFCAPQR